MCKRWIWYAKIGVGGSHMEHGDRLCACLGHGGGGAYGHGNIRAFDNMYLGV